METLIIDIAGLVPGVLGLQVDQHLGIKQEADLLQAVDHLLAVDLQQEVDHLLLGALHWEAYWVNYLFCFVLKSN